MSRAKERRAGAARADGQPVPATATATVPATANVPATATATATAATAIAPPAAAAEPEQRPLDLGIIRRLFGYMRPYARLRNRLFLLVAVRAVQLPLVTWATARVISGPVTRRDVTGTWAGVLGLLALCAFTELCFVYRMRFALRLGELVVHDLRNQIYAHLLRMPMSFFARTPVGRLIGRVTSDIDVIRVGVQDVAFVSSVSAGNMLVTSALMLYYDWKLFLIVLVMAPGLWTLIRHFRVKLSQAYRTQQESFSRVTARLAESVGGIREIQAFARQEVSADLFGQLIYDHSRNNMGAARQAAVFQPLLELNGQLFLSVLLVLGGYQALARDIPLAVLIQFLFLSNAFFSSIPNLGNQYNQALTAMAGAERVFALLDRRPDWQDAAGAAPLPPIAGRVELRDLGFAYQPGRPVLTGVSLTAEPGQTVALVGPTGSGKSTIVNLVAKLYLPTGGQILIDGHEIQQITGASLHRQIACVTQENFLFSGTVMENIRVGRPQATDDEVRAAARALDVTDLVEALPGGFETEVGERGAGISLGQRQVICFLRALLADPKILLLDEATSSVDTLTEQRLQAALFRLLAGRTCLVIAHRLGTIRHADEVVVLDHGRVAERGTHAALLAAGGLYAQMYRRLAAPDPGRSARAPDAEITG
jgi:ATP-binding cassette subfamily B protein